jgi:hypothetical protein
LFLPVLLDIEPISTAITGQYLSQIVMEMEERNNKPDFYSVIYHNNLIMNFNRGREIQ